MNAVDLHVHSNKSDGSFTPSELVDMAIAKGLTAFALTDHDTTAGVKEAVAYGQEKASKSSPESNFPQNTMERTSTSSVFLSMRMPPLFRSRSEALSCARRAK